MEEKRLQDFLRKAQLRIFLLQLGEILMWYLGTGLGIGILINGISLFWPLYGAWKIALGAVVLLVVLGVFYSIYRIPGKRRAALMIDERGLQERVSTALEQIEEVSPVAVLQRRDTLKHLEEFSFKEKFPVKKEIGKTLTLLVMLGIFTASACLPTQAKQEALYQHELKEEAKAQAEKAEELKRLLDTEKALQNLLKTQNKEMLKQEIDRSIEELFKAESQKDLLKAKKRLAKKTAQALEGVAAQELTPKAVSLLSEYMPKLSGEMQTAENTQNNAQSGQTKGENGTEGDGQNAGTQAGQSGEGASEGSDGNGQASGSENNGSEAGQGNDGSGKNGSGNNESGNNGSGNSGSGSGMGTGGNYGSNQGLEKTDIRNRGEAEKVTIPGRETGQDENVTGTGNSGSSQYEKGSQSQGFRGEKVDYDSVLGSYSQAAYDRLSVGGIPEGMENVVKNYFDGLNE